MFVELSEELAREKGIKNGSKVIVSTTRGDIEALACVTKRFKPFKVAVKKLTIGMLQFGSWRATDIANRLTPHIGDANTMCPEYSISMRHKEGVTMANMTNLWLIAAYAPSCLPGSL